ncbi:MAG: hypothetical protein AB1659_01485 [Thermodesulfobacteriota bacterium]
MKSLFVSARSMLSIWILAAFLICNIMASGSDGKLNLAQLQASPAYTDDQKATLPDWMGPHQKFPDFSTPPEIEPFPFIPQQPFIEKQPQPQQTPEREKTPPAAAPRTLPGLGLPSWLKPGVRITYYVTFASTPGASTEMVEAEKGKGTHWNPQTGQEYEERETSGTAGQGLMEVNVAYLDQHHAALDIRLLGKEVGSGDITILASVGDFGEARQCKDFWIHPQTLSQVKEMSTASGRILRMPYQLNNRTYNAIRFQGKNGHHTYDLDTGLLIARHGSAASTINTLTGNRLTVAVGGYVGIIQLLGVRATSFPWNAGEMPDWVGRTRSLTYQGKYTADVTAAGVYSFPVTMRLEMKNKGNGWVHFTQYSRLQAPPNMPQPMQGQVERVNGSSQVGGLWISPSALGQLRPGQVIDRDPFTGMQLSVKGVGNYIRLYEGNPRDSYEYLYDRQSGMLVGGTITKTLHMVRMVTSLSLSGKD